MIELSQKDRLINILKDTLKSIEDKDDDLDVSCVIIQQHNGRYIVDIHEYL